MPLIRSLLLAVAALAVAAAVAGAEPALLAPPIVDGAPQVGRPVVAGVPEVDDADAEDVTLSWERWDGRAFTAIPDAHDAAYTPALADLGRRLRVHAVLETADGADEAWSEATAPVRAATGERLRLGPAAGAPLRLARWTVAAGEPVRVTGALGRAFADADARVVLEPTLPGRAALESPVAIDAAGRASALVEPEVNAVAWLELAAPDAAPERVRLGVVGVRPRIRVALGARPDGRDAAGRRLVRDLRLLPGSALAPGLAGMRLTWEGMLPGDRVGTAVCRADERVVSGVGGVLRGGCRTRGAWASARWRLVLDPGTDDPLMSAFLPAASAWIVPRTTAAAASAPSLPVPRRGGGPPADVR